MVAPSDHLTGLTQARLKELLRYDPDTGVFTWLVWRPNGVKVGDAAGHTHKDTGYILIKIDGRKYPASRLAWLYMTGHWPDHLIDHKDTDKTNNRWANLRPASFAENIRNRNVHRNTQSGLKGAYLKSGHRAKPWAACIRVDGVLKHLGTFAKPEGANAAYAKAAEAAFGAFARS